MGPTASGKTALAVELCKHFPCDIISVDSALVYRGMDIGTAKPDATLLQQAPHRLIDIREVTQPYSAAEFREDALREMKQIVAAGRIPLLVGGTMLYFRTLEQGIAELPAADPAVRAQLEQEALALGWDVMHQRLQQIDPVAAQRIHPNDPQRIQRALEVHVITGKSMTEWFTLADSSPSPYRFIKLVLAPESRTVLHARISDRFDAMLEQGFIEEVRDFYQREDVHANLPAMRAVGYRQAWMYLQGEYSMAELRERGIIATRQYAKRQLTWLRSEENAHWFDSSEGVPVEQVIAFIESQSVC
ncbi:MAG: tRNA (adenosine(37)-N6)-dimethylallyltransferase MiaA [Gammaproteobacteria bacterium]|nr:tRNA (adenosine(37)-N6)-dimethylallyltransferase MiaA [Gammaproteobacteria bacterium]